MQTFKNSTAALLQRMTVQEKISLLSETAPAIPRLGINEYHHGNEALHGVVRPGAFTVFPQAIGMAASWNAGLINKVATAISDEARAKHNHFEGKMVGGDFDGLYNGLLTFWSPNLNVARDPRWGRTGETYGEDPYLAGECGVAFVRGLQGEDATYLKTTATPKHYVANNEEHNRFECNAVIPRKDLFEYYLPSFKAAVQQGNCAALMAAYNAVDGVPCHANSELLIDILRTRWGFDGYVVSDCGAVSHLWDRHNFAQSPMQAAAKALVAGVDLECGSCGTVQQVYGNYLEQALLEGLVTEQDINRAAGNVLYARFRLGMFNEATPWDDLSVAVVGCEQHVQTALEMAEESMVLLKNSEVNGSCLLPLSPEKLDTLCVVGNNAARCQFGDYSGTPQTPPITPIEALVRMYGANSVTHIPYEPSADTNYGLVPGEVLCHIAENGQRQPGLMGLYRMREAQQAVQRVDASINFEWENMAPDPIITAPCFSVRWQGEIIPPDSGRYQFELQHNPGDVKQPSEVQLRVSGALYAGGWVQLEAGKACPVTIFYRNCAAKPAVRLLWRAQQEAAHTFVREVEAAQKADVVVALLGLSNQEEAEGKDRFDLAVPSRQLQLLQQVYAVNPNIVVVFYNGSSLAMPWVKHHIPAILEAWYPGQQGGTALANILSGRVSPSGRLPLTFYSQTENLPPFNCYNLRQGNGFTYWYHNKPVDFPFGAGLGYSTFEKSLKSAAVVGDTLKGGLWVQNTGEIAASDVVQLYACYQQDGAPQPQKLCWFSKVHLEPGEQRQLAFEIPLERFAAYSAQQDDLVLRPGRYRLVLCEDAQTYLDSAVFDINNEC